MNYYKGSILFRNIDSEELKISNITIQEHKFMNFLQSLISLQNFLQDYADVEINIIKSITASSETAGKNVDPEGDSDI